MLVSGKALSPSANAFVLATGSPTDLAKLPPTEIVYLAILSRRQATSDQLAGALSGLALMSGKPPTKLLVDLINQAQDQADGNVIGLGKLLATQPVDSLKSLQKEVENLAVNGKTSEVTRLGYAAWVAAAGPGDAFLAASKSKKSLRDFLDAVPTVSEEARGSLFKKVRPLIFEMPTNLASEKGSNIRSNGVMAGYSALNGADAKSKTLDARSPSDWTVIENFEIMIPEGKSRNQFFNVFKSSIDIPKAGEYRFFTTSDDGSRLYIDDQEVVNNDGEHGMIRKGGSVTLTAGLHSIRVNYYDSGGDDGLVVQWQGSGFKRQPIPSNRLYTSGDETLHEVAIRAMVSIPGHEQEKFATLTTVLGSGKHQATAIDAIQKLPDSAWDPAAIGPVASDIVGYLSSLPATQRTTGAANKTIAFVRSLANRMPESEQAELVNRLDNLHVRVIAIGTVPHRMIYDKELLVVEAGKQVEFRFSNTDSMPHNFAITTPWVIGICWGTGRENWSRSRCNEASLHP